MSSPVVIVILHWDRSWMLSQCVSAIRQNTRHPYHIYIRDHGSRPDHHAHMKRLEGADCSIEWTGQFASCLQGRRAVLDNIDAPMTVFLDDDILVSPLWLTNLVDVMHQTGAAAVPMNLWSDVNAGPDDGQKYQLSGVRTIVCGEVRKKPWLYTGQGILCHGGATLYRTQALRDTEFRPEFNGSYEDWDQLLQITQDQGGTVFGSRVIGFHHHLDESRRPAYWNKRWRWLEVMTAALAAWDRWGIRSGVRDSYVGLLRYGVDIPVDLLARIKEAQIVTKQIPFALPEDIRAADAEQMAKL